MLIQSLRTHASSCPLNAQVVKEKQEFQRLTITKENLLRMFAYNKFKIRIITERVTTPTTTVYRCGPLIDLCRGPHVRHTGKVEQIALTKNSATYWEGAYAWTSFLTGSEPLAVWAQRCPVRSPGEGARICLGAWPQRPAD